MPKLMHVVGFLFAVFVHFLSDTNIAKKDKFANEANICINLFCS